MNKKSFAKLVSWIFHPIVIVLISPFLAVYRATSNLLYSMEWVAFTITFLVFEMIAFLIIRRKDFIKDFDVFKKEDRHIVYSICTFTALVYFIISIYFKTTLFPLFITALGIVLGIVVFDIVNYYFKISIHSAAISAFVISFGLFYGLSTFVFTFWLIPLMMWSRYIRKKHTFPETLGGAFLGIGIVLVTAFIGRFF